MIPADASRKRLRVADDDEPDYREVISKRLKYTIDHEGCDDVEKNLSVLKSGKWSDFKIKCRDRTFDVHRLVLLDHSPYFDSAIEGRFRETSEQQLDLSAEEPLLIAIILWYIYTKQFRLRDMHKICEWVNEPNNPTYSNSYLLLVKLHKCANYFMLQDFRKSIFRKLATLLTHFFGLGSMGRMREEKAMHRPLFLACIDYVFQDDEAIDRIKELFAWIMALINDRRSKLYLISDSHLDSILEKYPSLGGYMYRVLAAEKRQESRCFVCERLLVRERNERCLAIEFSGTIKWIRCICSWRGLCSDSCYSAESKTCRGGSRCRACCEGHDPARAWFMQKRQLSYQEGEIKWIPPAIQESDLNTTFNQ